MIVSSKNSKKDALLLPGQCLFEQGKTQEALKVNDKALKEIPKLFEVWYQRAKFLLSLNRFAEFEKCCFEAIGILDNNIKQLESSGKNQSALSTAYFNKGVVLVMMGHYELGGEWIDLSNDANWCFDQAIKNGLNISEVWIEKALIAVAHSEHQTALVFLVKAEQVNERSSEVHSLKASIFASIGYNTKAITSAKRALSLDPRNRQAALILTQLHIAQEEQL